jgi:hypothetical protein
MPYCGGTSIEVGAAVTVDVVAIINGGIDLLTAAMKKNAATDAMPDIGPTELIVQPPSAAIEPACVVGIPPCLAFFLVRHP